MTNESWLLKSLKDFLGNSLQSDSPFVVHRELIQPSDVFSRQRLAELIGNPLLSPEWLQVVHQGQAVDLSQDYFWKLVQKRQLKFLDKSRLKAALDAKASLVLEGVDILDPNLHELVEVLDNLLPCALVHCDAFWSRGGVGGNEAYGGHRDSDDVLVIQISGTKKWRIHEPQQRRYVGNSPLSEEQMGPLLLETVLNPGDVLYVRAGTPHRCNTPGDHSLHLSFDLNDRTPNIEQITHAANSIFKHALAPCHAPPTEVVTGYKKILDSDDFLSSLSRATEDFREEAKAFRRKIRGAHLKCDLL